MAKKVTLQILLDTVLKLTDRFDKLDKEHEKTRKLISNHKKQNRKDHNMIIGQLDDQIVGVKKRVDKLEKGEFAH